jgi:hypothetical protein
VLLQTNGQELKGLRECESTSGRQTLVKLKCRNWTAQILRI